MRIAIYGCGGYGREVMPIVQSGYDAVFVSDRAAGSRVGGVDVLSYDQLLSPEHADRHVVVALGDPAVRRSVVEKLETDNRRFASIVAPTVKQYDRVTVGEGAILSEYSVITSDVKIGRHFHSNLYSYVAHDCEIGDFVTFAPRVCCNGRIVIEDDVYVGTGALLRQGSDETPLVIGRGSVIGMGAVVTKNVPPFTTVVGSPARPLGAK